MLRQWRAFHHGYESFIRADQPFIFLINWIDSGDVFWETFEGGKVSAARIPNDRMRAAALEHYISVQQQHPFERSGYLDRSGFFPIVVLPDKQFHIPVRTRHGYFILANGNFLPIGTAIGGSNNFSVIHGDDLHSAANGNNKRLSIDCLFGGGNS